MGLVSPRRCGALAGHAEPRRNSGGLGCWSVSRGLVRHWRWARLVPQHAEGHRVVPAGLAGPGGHAKDRRRGGGRGLHCYKFASADCFHARAFGPSPLWEHGPIRGVIGGVGPTSCSAISSRWRCLPSKTTSGPSLFGGAQHRAKPASAKHLPRSASLRTGGLSLPWLDAWCRWRTWRGFGLHSSSRR